MTRVTVFSILLLLLLGCSSRGQAPNAPLKDAATTGEYGQQRAPVDEGASPALGPVLVRVFADEIFVQAQIRNVSPIDCDQWGMAFMIDLDNNPETGLRYLRGGFDRFGNNIAYCDSMTWWVFPNSTDAELVGSTPIQVGPRRIAFSLEGRMTAPEAPWEVVLVDGEGRATDYAYGEARRRALGQVGATPLEPVELEQAR